jgi:hypothetical protein
VRRRSLTQWLGITGFRPKHPFKTFLEKFTLTCGTSSRCRAAYFLILAEYDECKFSSVWVGFNRTTSDFLNARSGEPKPTGTEHQESELSLNCSDTGSTVLIYAASDFFEHHNASIACNQDATLRQ